MAPGAGLLPVSTAQSARSRPRRCRRCRRLQPFTVGGGYGIRKQFRLGENYHQGGGAKDVATALRWWRGRCAGHPGALRSLGQPITKGRVKRSALRPCSGGAWSPNAAMPAQLSPWGCQPRRKSSATGMPRRSGGGANAGRGPCPTQSRTSLRDGEGGPKDLVQAITG